MKRDSEHGRRRPSRIYAGNEPLPPVHPLVPLALVAPLVAVARVSRFFEDQYRQYSASPYADAPPPVDLSVERFEGLVLGLQLAIAACLAVVVLRWWRGRREWGDVPLAHGIAQCALALLLLSWVSFHPDGEVGVLDLLGSFGAQANLILGTVGAFLVYLVVDRVSRPICERRATLALLLLVPLLAGSLVRFGGLDGAGGQGDGFAGTPRTALPVGVGERPKVPFDLRRYNEGGWTPVYVGGSSGLAILRARLDARGEWIEEEAKPVAETAAERADERVGTSEFAPSPENAYPTGLVWLPRTAPGEMLEAAAAHARATMPELYSLRFLYLLADPGSDPVGGAGWARPTVGEFVVLLGDHGCEERLVVGPRGTSIEAVPDRPGPDSSDIFAVRVEEDATVQDVADAMAAMVKAGRASPRAFVFE